MYPVESKHAWLGQRSKTVRVDNPRKLGRQTIWICRSRSMMPDVDCGLCHASAIHISFAASLFVSRRSWNPTSTRSIAANKEYHLSRHSSHSGNAFLRFCTWTIVSSLFSRNTLYPSSSLPPRCQSFIVQEFFATSPVMSRSNVPWTIEIHAQLETHCFLRYTYNI